MVAKVLLIYGEGGHAEQMRRLKSLIDTPSLSANFYAVTDNEKRKKLNCSKTFIVFPMRLKEDKGRFVSFCYSFFAGIYNLILSLIILLKVRPNVVISTGPLIFLFFFVFCKPFNIKLIYIETWSRFYSKSISGRVGYFFADIFYIQNEELKLLYPKSVYSGRL
ncbi:PssD/Cps14F family polysaccharide biosynthesis glycosyltransferase [Shewanella putrefaciens]|uniref:Uncharacterized protein n=1 Tax=Shewanella putrefaciens TaxID=24 RepID=A0ABX8X7U2_SHEPU|nr:PssD/Cps14F family polysaccharide biosynthesis glycosyltransferase [Shewanella putrefaciens]MCT8945143.1 UDP-N-acetylglucosamine transferase subunit ALG14 [Shewanella putrefaciens]QSE48231.1 hypothetical protein JW975_12725 [Shewanella putrefaciens]QYX71636.1 hypothetical protein K3G22_12710 [Shewanella putrefaciens]GGN27174.1 hypothetical protein GCM10007984_30370 [Shewanella putrefaciens]